MTRRSVVAAIDDPRVRWINLPTNTGHQSAPNNEGLRQARGEIIAYLGHDDLWLPHHLAALVDAFDRSPSDLAYALAINVAPDGSVWPVIPRPAYGSFASPLSMAHRKRVTEEMGGWRDYRELSDPPDVELWRRAQQRGYTFTFVPRLTGIKFPASWRRGIYETRPSHEQAAWLARIDREADFEPRQLAKIIVSDHALNGLPYRDLAGVCARRQRGGSAGGSGFRSSGCHRARVRRSTAFGASRVCRREGDVAGGAQGHPGRHQ